MDEKMMQMLSQLIEGQNETNKQLSELTNRVGGLESKLEGFETKLEGFETKLEGFESKVEGLELKVDRTMLFMEETQTNIKIIGEGIVAFRQQVDRQFDHVHTILSEKTDLLETVIKAHSSEVNKLKDESKHIQGIIGEHEVSIRILKASNS